MRENGRMLKDIKKFRGSRARLRNAFSGRETPVAKNSRQEICRAANILQMEIQNGNYICLTPGMESRLGVTWVQLLSAVNLLVSTGYHRTWMVKLGSGNVIKVLGPDDFQIKDVLRNRHRILYP